MNQPGNADHESIIRSKAVLLSEGAPPALRFDAVQRLAAVYPAAYLPFLLDEYLQQFRAVPEHDPAGRMTAWSRTAAVARRLKQHNVPGWPRLLHEAAESARSVFAAPHPTDAQLFAQAAPDPAPAERPAPTGSTPPASAPPTSAPPHPGPQPDAVVRGHLVELHPGTAARITLS